MVDNIVTGTITLTVSPSSDVEVNQIVTLQCSFQSNPINANFFSSRNPMSSFCDLAHSGGVCQPNACTSTYTTACPNDKTYSVQYPVPRSWNGASVVCGGILTGKERSDPVTFSVTVPVTSVTLTPAQITVDVNKQVTLTCQTDYCNPAATITWYKSSTVISSQITSTTDSNSDGLQRTTSVLTITGVKGDNGQEVYCEASNRPGQQVASNRGVLNVRYPPSSDPVITASPPGLHYDSGTRVSLTCQLSGGNPIATLSWKCKGVDMTGANQSTATTAESVLSLVMDSSYNNKQCTCTASHPLLSTPKSASVTLNVTVLVTSVALTPAQITVDINKQATLTCETDYCNPAASITWYKSSTVISNQPTSTTDTNSDGLYRTTSVLTYTGVSGDNGLQVHCIASNRQGQQVESSKRVLNVRYPPSSDPVITASPPGLQHDSGTRVILTCKLSGGNPIATLSWRCKEVDMTGTDQITTTTAVSVLSLVMDSSYNNKQCICTANHPLLSTPKSASVTLNVIVLVTSVTLIPAQITVDVDKQIDVTCQTDYCNPAASITWYKSFTPISSQPTPTTDTNSDGLYRTTSVLTYTGVAGDNGLQVYCIASNRPGQQVESSRGVLNVSYPPSSDPSITASPSGLQYDNGTRVSLTCKLSGGNPIATLSWRCKGVDMTGTNQSTTTTAVSVLPLVMDSSYNNKQCTCTANHPLLTSTKSDSIRFTVFYNNVITSNVSGEHVISEHGQLQIECDVDGNPLSTITWLFVPNNTVVKRESDVSSSSLDISSANCLDHGRYKVTADNGKGPAAVRTFKMVVRCKPRLFHMDSQTPEKLGIGNNESLQIFVKILLYPPATQMVWNFTGKSDQSNVIQNNTDGYIITDTKGEIEQNITLYKSRPTVDEFGRYTIKVQNDVGTFSRIYHVDSARPPFLPSNVTLLCDNPSHIEISWISNFNGGDSQTFKIFYSTDGDLSTSYKDLENVSDNGYGRLHSYTPWSIDKLQGKVWFKVTAFNKYGNSTPEAVSCNIVAPDTSNVAAIVGGAAGGGIGLAVVVIVIVVFVRRYSNHAKQASNNHRLKDNVDENESADDDGLKENALYVSADIANDEKPGPSGMAVYAEVKKKSPGLSDNNANVYAEVKKTGPKVGDDKAINGAAKPKKGLFKKEEKPKQKKGKKQKLKQDVPDVYENSEDIAMKQRADDVYSNTGENRPPKPEQRGYKNQDGLLYVEVQFDAKKDNGKSVIHGEEEKTDYATVEFPFPPPSQKAAEGEKKEK